MSDDKQIEEMTKDLCDIECKGMKCNECDGYGCEYRMLAEALYNAGYRKASDFAREIFEAIYRISIGCSIENNIMRLTLEKNPYVLVVLASEFDKIRKKYESEDER